jgi:hypothetical protein
LRRDIRRAIAPDFVIVSSLDGRTSRRGRNVYAGSLGRRARARKAAARARRRPLAACVHDRSAADAADGRAQQGGSSFRQNQKSRAESAKRADAPPRRGARSILSWRM